MTESESGEKDALPAGGGILVSRGVSLTLSNISFTIGPDGFSGSDAKVTVSLDLTPYWLEIAVSQTEVALEEHAAVLAAWKAGDSASMGAAMEAECKASMQAAVAAGVALDAFYATVRRYVTLSEEEVTTWRAKRTARYKQVAEVFRRGFVVGPKSTKILSKTLGQIFDVRDKAVHPPATASEPVLYPEIRTGTEWRFVMFCGKNAQAITRESLSVVAQLLGRPREKNVKLVEYCRPALANIEPTVTRWEERYGQLYPRPS